jgi:hypothetical protein
MRIAEPTWPPSGPPQENDATSCYLRVAFWFLGLSLGIAETIASRFSMTVDGISYLDLGRAIWAGDWKTAVNGYWSPLYAWLLGGAIHVTHVTPYWESTLVHSMNFLIFIGSMAAFEMFIRELHLSRLVLFSGDGDCETLPFWAMQAIGYSLCLYSGLVWGSIGNVTPDQCVVVIMYSAAALLLRMHRLLAGWIVYAELGILLGIGYLIKAAFFPLGIACLISTLFLAPSFPVWQRVARSITAGVFFGMIAAPLVVALSVSKGRFTFGDSGKLNYAMFVDGLTIYGHWQGEGGLGTPKHPVRKVWNKPEVFEFATPVGGTYPPWYDSSYWRDGLVTHIDIRGQFRALADGARAYLAIARQEIGLIVAIIVLCAMDWKRDAWPNKFVALWPAWLLPLAGLGMFWLVLVETRYVASFIVILAMCCLGGIRVHTSQWTRRVLIVLTLVVVVQNLMGVALVAPRNAYSSIFRPRHTQWEVARALTEQGVRPGDRVATVIDHRIGDYWAYLAGVKIVEEIPYQQLPQVATLDATSRAELINVMRRPGVDVIVTIPNSAQTPGFQWRRLANTTYFVALLGKTTQQ